jgi:hypothetical protein
LAVHCHVGFHIVVEVRAKALLAVGRERPQARGEGVEVADQVADAEAVARGLGGVGGADAAARRADLRGVVWSGVSFERS